MFRTYFYLLLAAMLVIAGCSKNSETLEPTWGVYQEPIQPKLIPEDSGVEEISVQWREYVGEVASRGLVTIKPAYENGILYVVNRNGELRSYDATNGEQQQVYYFNKAVYTGVGVGEGLAVVAHEDGSVTAMDTVKGAIKWSRNLKRQISAIPAIASGRVIVRGSGGLVFGLNADNGEVVWKTDKETSGFSVYGTATPVITGDAVLIGLSNGNLIANNVINGREYWESELSANYFGGNEVEQLSDSDTPPVVVGNSVYTGTYNGDVVALDLFNGQNLWRADISTRLPMAHLGDKLVAVSDLGAVSVLDLTNGSIEWQSSILSGHGVSPPAVIGNRVLVGDSNGNVHTFSLQDGTLIESRNLVAGAVIDIFSEDNNAWVFSSEGRIAAVSIP